MQQFVYVSAVMCQQRWEPCRNAEEVSKGEEPKFGKTEVGGDPVTPGGMCMCVMSLQRGGYRRQGRWRSTRRGG